MPAKNPKFDLKLKYQRMFEIGIIFSIAIVILAFRFFPEIKSQKKYETTEKEYVDVEDIISTDNLREPPVPPKPIIPIEVEFQEDELHDILFNSSELIENEKMGSVKKVDKEDVIEETLPFRFVEQMPEIVGGLSSLQKTIIYPELAVKAGIEGKVILEVVIGKNGELETIKLIKGIGAGCDEAAIDAVKNTKFKAGEQRGKPVRVVMVIPIRFDLKN